MDLITVVTLAILLCALVAGAGALALRAARRRDLDRFERLAELAIRPRSRRDLIRSAPTEAHLDRAWRVWFVRGASRDGLLFADLVARGVEIRGGQPTPDERAVLDRAKRLREAAKNLPAIRGRGR